MAHQLAYRVFRGCSDVHAAQALSTAGRHLRQLSATAAAADTDFAVIGAGVVGLAIARELALAGRSVLLLEAGAGVGLETSSRSSEVIHAGLYYPEGSLKARLCVEGRRLLYAFCERHNVPHARLGKLVVAAGEAQLGALRALAARGAANGVRDLRLLSAGEAAALQPGVRCAAALLSPSTGIVCSHSFMTELLRQFEEAGGTLALHSRVVGGAVGTPPHRLAVRDVHSGEEVELTAAAVVNAAGLHAQAVAASLHGMPPEAVPPLHLAKGSYFSLAPAALASMAAASDGAPASSHAASKPYAAPRPRPFFRHLIYPLPEPGTAGLGTHLTLDLGGGVRFGPDVEWLPLGTCPTDVDYGVSAARAQPFYAAIRAYLPALPDGSLVPAYSGVRPKVAGPGEPAGDFVLQGPQQHGVPGLLNLFGIESPGLTASLAIARRAVDVLRAASRPGLPSAAASP